MSERWNLRWFKQKGGLDTVTDDKPLPRVQENWQISQTLLVKLYQALWIGNLSNKLIWQQCHNIGSLLGLKKAGNRWPPIGPTMRAMKAVDSEDSVDSLDWPFVHWSTWLVSYEAPVMPIRIWKWYCKHLGNQNGTVYIYICTVYLSKVNSPITNRAIVSIAITRVSYLIFRILNHHQI